MPSPIGDPAFIKNKERFFMQLAEHLSLASSNPLAPGGCVIVRDREIIADGRSLLSASKVEIDCVSYAIAVCAKRGAGAVGAVIYTTRYPSSSATFQAHLMGIRKILVLAHEWETRYLNDFRASARLGRELGMTIDAFYPDDEAKPQAFKTAFPQTAENAYAVDEFDESDQDNSDVSVPL
jgi:deoxycytidylate deaminase